MEKCQVDDTVSSSDRTGHGVASSTGENKTITQSQRDTEISTISSEKGQSTQQTSIRGDVNSENMQPLNKGRKGPVADRTDEVRQAYPTTKVSSHYDQFRTDSLSSKESGEAIGISSVDSAGPKLYQSSDEKSIIKQDTCVYSYATQSDESRNVQEPDSSHMATMSNPVALREHSLHKFKFDLNEDMEADGPECPQPPQTLQELNSSVRGVHLSEPIPVVAKVGVFVGLPPKPLQFGGELGWRRSVTTSAFRCTFSRNFYREKGDCSNLSDCDSRQSLVTLGIDLNVAATVDPELSADETSVDMSSKQPERFLLDLNCQTENNEDRHKPGSLGFNLNDNYVIEDTATCSVGNGSKPGFDCRVPSYLINLSSTKGFSHVQAPLLVAAPTAEGMRMMVPVQSGVSFFPHAPSGLYMGKINSLSPTFYPTSVLPHLNNQHGILAAYPRTVHVLQNPQGLNPNLYANLPPTFIQNDGVALMENGSRGASNAEFLIPARSTLVEDRMKPTEQLAFPASYAKRKEPDGGWDSSQINSKWMAPWS